MTFENGLTASFQVQSLGTAILHEEPDPNTPINWDAPGPFFPSQSNRVVQTDQPFHVHTRFNVSGLLANVLPGRWEVKLYFEQYGAGEASPGEYKAVNSHVLSSNNNYNIAVMVPGNQLSPGLYKMALLVTFISVNGQPLPITGFEEIGPIQVYQG